MADESVSATAIIDAAPEVIFGVLADPAKHAAIDGTGWIREPSCSVSLINGELSASDRAVMRTARR